VAGAYIAIAWLVTEIASFLLEQAAAPGWTLRLLAIVFLVGFSVTLVLAWIVQIQPDGKWSIDSSKGQQKTVSAAVALGIIATAGLSWLILPHIQDSTTVSDYQALPNTLAILPLDSADATPSIQTISDTLLDALRTGLDQTRELKQIVLPVEERPSNPAAFGREFKASALLMGRIVRATGGLRIEMELLDVGRDEVRWAETFSWDATRSREIGTEISNGVLRSMGMQAISQYQFAGTNSQPA